MAIRSGSFGRGGLHVGGAVVVRLLGPWLGRQRRLLVAEFVALGVCAGRDDRVLDEVTVEIIVFERRLVGSRGLCVDPWVVWPDPDPLGDLVLGDVEHHEVLGDGERTGVVGAYAVDRWQCRIGVRQDVGGDCQPGLCHSEDLPQGDGQSVRTGDH